MRSKPATGSLAAVSIRAGNVTIRSAFSGPMDTDLPDLPARGCARIPHFERPVAVPGTADRAHRPASVRPAIPAHAPVAVCVPVRDERTLLPRLLDALDRQVGTDPARVHLCLFFDGCEDDGVALVRERAAAMASHIAVEVGARAPEPNAGRARAAAMGLGTACLADLADAVLLTTDADSAPRPDWIVTACRALQSADIVTGRIVREHSERDTLQARIETYYDRLYALRRTIDPVAWEPQGGHHFTAGANLGFRSRAYRALGGFASRPSGEDALIVDEAGRAGLRVRRDARVVVETSSRRDGRAQGGLATALSAFDSDAVAASGVIVAHPADAAWQWHAQAQARAAFEPSGEPGVRALLAQALGLKPDHILGVARDCPNAEAFAMRIAPTVPGGERRVSLGVAERALAALERVRQDRAA